MAVRRWWFGAALVLAVLTRPGGAAAQDPPGFMRIGVGVSGQDGSSDYRPVGLTVHVTAGYMLGSRVGLRLDGMYQRFHARRVIDAPGCFAACPTVALAPDAAQNATAAVAVEWRQMRDANGLYAVTGVAVSRRSGVELQDPGWAPAGVLGIGLQFGLIGFEVRLQRYVGVPGREAWNLPVTVTLGLL